MIKAVIIENEKSSADSLKADLNKYCKDIEIVGDAPSVYGGIDLISKHKPEIIFLDIELNDGSGFDLLEKIPAEERNSLQLIFTTSHNEFAIKAFKFCAIDYLLKPVDADELQAAVNKAKEKIEQKSVSNNISILFENLKQQGRSQKIVLPSGDSILVYKIENIIRCESQRNYTQFHFVNDKSLLVSKTMKEYEDLLSSHGFERVHNSHLINLSFVKKYVKSDGGYIEMLDGTNIPVAQTKKAHIVNILAGS